ncbi:hypothetical protein EKG83_36595 [Saccharothrix syringae]|uniref:Uncharacterized protein n=1 Tax=Saccharothrix syringae TaxID=103733 RepID=A0A5Q0H894_SACSY|nr:hypothetical protein EKG83_36595 [Saccharothrix syringae]
MVLGPGGLNADLDLATGAFTGDLVLPPTSGKFTVLGFLPVESKVEFAPVGKTTGTLSAGSVRSNSKVTIKLPSITVFGIPISSDAACGTSTPASIDLVSGPGFDPLTGGRLSGTYTIPALTGCGLFNDLVSGLTAGPDNAIELTLTPKTA